MRLSNHERAAVSKTAGICRDKGGNLVLKVLALLSIAAPVHCLAEAGRPAFVAANGGRGGRLAAKRSGRGRNATRQPLTSKPGIAGRLLMQATGTGTGGFPPLPETYPPKRKIDYELEEGQVGVRFINTSGDPDVVVGAYPGEKVTEVAKRAGITIPTACATGICGTCTTDLEDRAGKSYRPGFQIVKACVTKVTLVPGAEEMVLDVYRNRSSKGKLNRHLPGGKQSEDDWTDADMPVQTLGEAMSRFSEGWEKGVSAKETKPAERRAAAGTKGRERIERVVKPVLTERQQKIMANRYARNELPEEAAAYTDQLTGKNLIDHQEAIYRESLKEGLSEIKREKVNFYLDNAPRAIPSVEDLLTLTEEERRCRSRYFSENPTTPQQSYGPWGRGTPEELREERDSNGNRYEGTNLGRSAAYRAASQIPRYRFWGDPPLHETDAEYMRTREVQTSVSEDDMAEVEFRKTVNDWTRRDNTQYVYRHARTGRPAKLMDAGRPWTVKGEQRQKPLLDCSFCNGTGRVKCEQCKAVGLSYDGSPQICSRCSGEQEISCPRCYGIGVPELR